jgi:uncharacterized membrane protein YjjP (DUF1212 family)
MEIQQTTERKASAPTWGGLRDGLIAVFTTAAGAFVLSQTDNHEMAQSAREFTGSFANLVLGAAVGLGSFGRKWVAEKRAE